MASYRNGLLTVVALLSVVLLACGGSGDGGGGGSPMAPSPGIVFTASGGTASDAIELRQQGAGGNVLVLEVRAVDVSDLYGLAFDLEFPTNLLRFDGFNDGGWLSAQGAVSTELLVTEVGDSVVVGLSRLGNVAGRNGSGLLMTLEFTGTSSGSGSLSFGNDSGFDSDGFEIGLTFSGGSVRVTL